MLISEEPMAILEFGDIKYVVLSISFLLVICLLTFGSLGRLLTMVSN